MAAVSMHVTAMVAATMLSVVAMMMTSRANVTAVMLMMRIKRDVQTIRVLSTVHARRRRWAGLTNKSWRGTRAWWRRPQRLDAW